MVDVGGDEFQRQRYTVGNLFDLGLFFLFGNCKQTVHQEGDVAEIQ